MSRKNSNIFSWIYKFYKNQLHTAQKMKFFVIESFSKCDQIYRNLWIWTQLLQKALMENFIFCTVCQRPHPPSYESNRVKGNTLILI